MPIIREMPSVSPTTGRQVGGANRPTLGASYEASPLRRMMEPGLAAFGQQFGGQLGGTFGAAIGKGLGGAAVEGVGGALMDQSQSPAQGLAATNASILHLMKKYKLPNMDAFRNPGNSTENTKIINSMTPQDAAARGALIQAADFWAAQAYENTMRTNRRAMGQ